jgi:hypothetical protein
MVIIPAAPAQQVDGTRRIQERAAGAETCCADCHAPVIDLSGSEAGQRICGRTSRRKTLWLSPIDRAASPTANAKTGVSTGSFLSVTGP